MPLAFIVPLGLVVHECVAEFEQSLDVPVRGASLVEAFGVDGLKRHLIAEHQRRTVGRGPECFELRVGPRRDRGPVVSGTLELQVQLVDGRFQKRDGRDNGSCDAGPMARHSLGAHRRGAAGLDTLRHRDEVAGSQQVLALEAVLDAPRNAGGCGRDRLCAKAAAFCRTGQNE